jgi:uncharacterized repeat protein (TIGR03806 family)
MGGPEPVCPRTIGEISRSPADTARHIFAAVPANGRQLTCSVAVIGMLCACGSSRITGQPGGPDAGTGSGSDAGVVYGLDARPSNTTCLAPSRPAAAIALQPALGGQKFNWPTFVLQAPADPTRFFVVQKGGVVRAVSRDGSTASDFIDITAQTNSSYEETGLLGMTFHPRWQTNHQAFLFYSAHDGTARDLTSTLSRFTSKDGGKTLDKSSEEILFTLQKDPADNHNGGMIAFGPDGYLYLGLGDGGGAGDVLNHAQDTSSLFGKFLRIDVDHGSPYTIPPDNPFAGGSGGKPEIFAWGFRNPWRWSFDGATGLLWAGDVGQANWEEIDVVRKGLNYGWRIREGMHCYPPGSSCSTAGLTDPIVEYDHSQGFAVTGGYVYRGTALQGLVGSYLYADFGSGNVWSIPASAGEAGQPRPAAVKLLASGKNISSFGQDLDGELYVADLNGGIYQIVPPPAGTGAGGPAKLLSQTGCTAPGDVTRPAPGLVPYAPAAPFWSDGAVKERWLSIPDGTQITQGPDGDFDFPPGTVLVKSFSLGGKRIETRLFFRYADGGWAGFTYAWNAQGTDATLVSESTDVDVSGQTWTLPSPAQCLSCHTAAAGFSLGLEAAQLDSSFQYPTGRTANQLATLIHLEMVAPGPAVPALPDPQGSGPLDQRARAILHVNCSQCHRPGGPAPDGDFRFGTAPSQGFCGKAPVAGDLGVPGALLVAPGQPEKSLVVLRMQALDEHRMPPLATHVVDQASVDVLSSWIRSLSSCP